MRTVFYAAIGANLVLYKVDDESLTLTRDHVTRIPESVQYAWVHPVLPVMYVAYSNRSQANDRHGVVTYRIDQGTGRLHELGSPIVLQNRPIHLSVDPAGSYLLIAYNLPSDVSVHQLIADGSIGDTVVQQEPVDAGTYAHQVRVAPSGEFVVLSTRGNHATSTKPEDPGALKVFRFADGQLTDEKSVANGDGLGFGPRHVDFHPAAPWMYVSMERSNEMLAYQVHRDGIAASPRWASATVSHPESRAPIQYVGPIHVHPSGRYLYVANRSDGTVEFDGKVVHGPGENSVAVFSIDNADGQPSLIQSVEIQAYHPRTFAIHPNGTMMVTAAVKPLAELHGDQVRSVPAGFSVFGIGDDGRLTFVGRYDVDPGTDLVFWCGMVGLVC